MPNPAYGYGQFLRVALSSNPVNLLNDPIKVMLCSSSYTPNQDTHVYKSDVAQYEITGTGYTAGGKALTNKTLTYNPTTNEVIFNADDVVWTDATFTARYAVIYADIGTNDNQKPLIAYIDFEADRSCYQSDFIIDWSSSGILSFKAL